MNDDDLQLSNYVSILYSLANSFEIDTESVNKFVCDQSKVELEYLITNFMAHHRNNRTCASYIMFLEDHYFIYTKNNKLFYDFYMNMVEQYPGSVKNDFEIHLIRQCLSDVLEIFFDYKRKNMERDTAVELILNVHNEISNLQRYSKVEKLKEIMIYFESVSYIICNEIELETFINFKKVIKGVLSYKHWSDNKYVFCDLLKSVLQDGHKVEIIGFFKQPYYLPQLRISKCIDTIPKSINTVMFEYDNTIFTIAHIEHNKYHLKPLGKIPGFYKTKSFTQVDSSELFNVGGTLFKSYTEINLSIFNSHPIYLD